MEQAVVRAGPEEPGLMRRLGEGEDGGVVLGADGVAVDRAAGRPERFGIGAGQIGADRLPALALVVAPKTWLPAM